MPAAPPAHVLDQIDAASTRVTRRVEIYEADGTTRWVSDPGTLLLDGSVNVDYGRDERRTVDLRLDNSSGVLIADPNGGFWYDKILKVFRGVDGDDLVVETSRNYMPNPDFDDTDISKYTVSVGTIARQAGVGVDGSNGLVFTASAAPTTNCYVQHYTDHRIAQEGDPFTYSVYLKSPTAGLYTQLYLIYQDSAGANIGSSLTAIFPITTSMARYSISLPAAGPTASRIRVITYLRGGTGASAPPASSQLHYDRPLLEKTTTPSAYYTGSKYATYTGKWEVQIGEFMIDRMSEPFFPNIVSITGRDYAKKCLTSKFGQATGFSSGTTIETVIRAIGQNAGITKFLFPVTGKTLGRDFVFEAGVERWKAMTEIAKAYGHELFFDTQGFCVLQQLQDPATSPVVAIFKTGAKGNLASYDKSMNDSRIYNHMVVTGEATETIPVFAEAKNEQPNSPTRIARIGDRVYRYTSSFITTVAQALDVAERFLKIHALEEYDVNIDSLVYPWLEAGDIIQFLDPDAGANQPTNFLLSSLTIPLGLAPMSCNAKRVAIVSG